MKRKALEQRALASIKETQKLPDVVLVHSSEAIDPESGDTIHEFVAVSADDPNGPSYRVIVDDKGKPRNHMPERDITEHASTPVVVPGVALAAPVTIQPDTNVLTLNPGDTLGETIVVTIPKDAGTAKADVYFLADTTGSMGGVLAAVQAGSNNILTALNGLGLDLMFGVGNYKDFGSVEFQVG